jgi:hypothetical protein
VEVKEILAELDREISRLQQVRALLAGGTVRKTRGPNNKSAAVVSAVAASAPKKRNLTPEGRKRIAEAMKRRWAERKKLASAKPSK